MISFKPSALINHVRDSLHYRRKFLLHQLFFAKRTGFERSSKLFPFPTPEAGNDLIKKKILSGEPLMIARHGSLELDYVINGHGAHLLHSVAGFFPNDRALGKKFTSHYLESCQSMDVLCCWNYRHGFFKEEQELFSEHSPIAELADLGSLSAFLFPQPWSEAMQNRRVLVVHPFEDTIVSQYSKRELLFKNPAVLPEFESLHTVRAVQSIEGQDVPFDTWFDALDYMQTEVSKHDFDIALIACGAYGLPLAAFIKSIGKQAIHIGGALQLLFGIRGSRWEGAPYNYDQTVFNEHWVRPGVQEIPKDYKSVECSSYW